VPLSEAQTYLDHLGACSPCYRDFLELQAKYRQRRTQMIFAVAASVLIVVVLASWAMLRQHNLQIAHTVLDLRERSIARGTERPSLQSPVEISRSTSRLDIYLPLGSSEGAYDVRFLNSRDETLLEASGVAKVQSGITVLPLNVTLSSLDRGYYTLQIRRAASDWSSFSLRLK